MKIGSWPGFQCIEMHLKIDFITQDASLSTRNIISPETGYLAVPRISYSFPHSLHQISLS